MMLKEYRHGLQTRTSHCGYVRLGLAGKSTFFFLLVIVLICSITYIIEDSSLEELKSNNAFTIGTFNRNLKLEKNPKVGGRIYTCGYTFVINNVNYDGYYALDLSNSSKLIFFEKIFDKNYTVIYQKNNIENNRMLIFPKDYEQLELKAPDSAYSVLEEFQSPVLRGM